MADIFLLCGKPGCGKTTISNYMQQKYGMIGFSADDFMLKLYGELQDRVEFDKKLAVCKDVIYGITQKLIDRKIKVVLDFGFWTKKERQEVKQRFSGYDIKFIYICKNDDEIFSCVEKRNASLKENEYFMDRTTFDFLASKFEEPSAEEAIRLQGGNESEIDDLLSSI